MTNKKIDKECELCKLIEGNIITKKYYEDDIIIIVSCEHCNVPLLVLKRHTMQPTKNELSHMNRLMINRFPDRYVRKKQRSIQDHLHWHLIKKYK